MSAARPESIREQALAHVDGLFALARRLTGSDAEAEDLVQETYARALRAEPSFERGTNLRAWLFRILRNVRVDGLRRRRASPEVPADDDLVDEAAAAPAALRGDAELARLRTVVAADIERALATLTEDARAIVLLDLEGFTEGELAAILGCAIGTVKSRLSRARGELRRALADYGR